jgi:hypothetical protein
MAADERIELLTSGSYDDQGQALAAMTEVVSIVNMELQAESARAPQPGAEEFFGGAAGDRIRQWIEKLARMLKKIAEQFEAMSYTITVGVAWPPGVSVSVTWTPKPA